MQITLPSVFGRSARLNHVSLCSVLIAVREINNLKTWIKRPNGPRYPRHGQCLCYSAYKLGIVALLKSSVCPPSFPSSHHFPDTICQQALCLNGPNRLSAALTVFERAQCLIHAWIGPTARPPPSPCPNGLRFLSSVAHALSLPTATSS